MDVYDLIILLMSWFPGIGPAVIAASVGLTALMAAVSSGLAGARIIVKLTFWTTKDDELLAKFEKKYKEITEGPLRPLFVVIDRLAILNRNILKS